MGFLTFKSRKEKEHYDLNKPLYQRLEKIEDYIKDIRDSLSPNNNFKNTPISAKNISMIHPTTAKYFGESYIKSFTKGFSSLINKQAKEFNKLVSNFAKERKEELKQQKNIMTGLTNWWQDYHAKFWLKHPVLYNIKEFLGWLNKNFVQNMDQFFGLTQRQIYRAPLAGEYQIQPMSPMASLVSINQAIHRRLYLFTKYEFNDGVDKIVKALENLSISGSSTIGGTGGSKKNQNLFSTSLIGQIQQETKNLQERIFNYQGRTFLEQSLHQFEETIDPIASLFRNAFLFRFFSPIFGKLEESAINNRNPLQVGGDKRSRQMQRIWELFKEHGLFGGFTMGLVHTLMGEDKKQREENLKKTSQEIEKNLLRKFERRDEQKALEELFNNTLEKQAEKAPTIFTSRRDILEFFNRDNLEYLFKNLNKEELQLHLIQNLNKLGKNKKEILRNYEKIIKSFEEYNFYGQIDQERKKLKEIFKDKKVEITTKWNISTWDIFETRVVRALHEALEPMLLHSHQVYYTGLKEITPIRTNVLNLGNIVPFPTPNQPTGPTPVNPDMPDKTMITAAAYASPINPKSPNPPKNQKKEKSNISNFPRGEFEFFQSEALPFYHSITDPYSKDYQFLNHLATEIAYFYLDIAQNPKDLAKAKRNIVREVPYFKNIINKADLTDRKQVFHLLAYYIGFGMAKGKSLRDSLPKFLNPAYLRRFVFNTRGSNEMSSALQTHFLNKSKQSIKTKELRQIWAKKSKYNMRNIHIGRLTNIQNPEDENFIYRAFISPNFHRAEDVEQRVSPRVLNLAHLRNRIRFDTDINNFVIGNEINKIQDNETKFFADRIAEELKLIHPSLKFDPKDLQVRTIDFIRQSLRYSFGLFDQIPRGNERFSYIVSNFVKNPALVAYFNNLPNNVIKNITKQILEDEFNMDLSAANKDEQKLLNDVSRNTSRQLKTLSDYIYSEQIARKQLKLERLENLDREEEKLINTTAKDKETKSRHTILDELVHPFNVERIASNKSETPPPPTHIEKVQQFIDRHSGGLLGKIMGIGLKGLPLIMGFSFLSSLAGGKSFSKSLGSAFSPMDWVRNMMNKYALGGLLKAIGGGVPGLTMPFMWGKEDTISAGARSVAHFMAKDWWGPLHDLFVSGAGTVGQLGPTLLLTKMLQNMGLSTVNAIKGGALYAISRNIPGKFVNSLIGTNDVSEKDLSSGEKFMRKSGQFIVSTAANAFATYATFNPSGALSAMKGLTTALAGLGPIGWALAAAAGIGFLSLKTMTHLNQKWAEESQKKYEQEVKNSLVYKQKNLVNSYKAFHKEKKDLGLLKQNLNWLDFDTDLKNFANGANLTLGKAETKIASNLGVNRIMSHGKRKKVLEFIQDFLISIKIFKDNVENVISFAKLTNPQGLLSLLMDIFQKYGIASIRSLTLIQMSRVPAKQGVGKLRNMIIEIIAYMYDIYRQTYIDAYVDDSIVKISGKEKDPIIKQFGNTPKSFILFIKSLDNILKTANNDPFIKKNIQLIMRLFAQKVRSTIVGQRKTWYLFGDTYYYAKKEVVSKISKKIASNISKKYFDAEMTSDMDQGLKNYIALDQYRKKHQKFYKDKPLNMKNISYLTTEKYQQEKRKLSTYDKLTNTIKIIEAKIKDKSLKEKFLNSDFAGKIELISKYKLLNKTGLKQIYHNLKESLKNKKWRANILGDASLDPNVLLDTIKNNIYTAPVKENIGYAVEATKMSKGQIKQYLKTAYDSWTSPEMKKKVKEVYNNIHKKSEEYKQAIIENAGYAKEAIKMSKEQIQQHIQNVSNTVTTNVVNQTNVNNTNTTQQNNINNNQQPNKHPNTAASSDLAKMDRGMFVNYSLNH